MTNNNYAQIYKAEGEIEAHIIKGLLESAEIKRVINPINYNYPLQPYSFQTKDCIPYGICVPKDKVEEAKEILTQRG